MTLEANSANNREFLFYKAMMKDDLKKVWTEVITPDDLDRHMENIGQAEANAVLVQKMLNEHASAPGDHFLIAGCGTGQLLDYLDPETFSPFQITFSDINEAFLAKLRRRLQHMHLMAKVIKDDLEVTGLKGPFDAVLAVLVLEHIDWRKGIANLVDLCPQKLFFIIQEQSTDKPMLTVNAELPDSIRKASELATADVVTKEEIRHYLDDFGYRLAKTYHKRVPQEKTMVGLVFESRLSADV